MINDPDFTVAPHAQDDLIERRVVIQRIHVVPEGGNATARATALAHGVPVTPGSGIMRDPESALAEARRIGFPIMIKATAGGGGRGMRPCFHEAEFINLFYAASYEALGAFGNGEC